MIINSDYKLVISISIVFAVIISIIPNFSYSFINLFNYNIVRNIFISFIGYLTITNNLEYALILTILFLIMLELTKKLDN